MTRLHINEKSNKQQPVLKSLLVFLDTNISNSSDYFIMIISMLRQVPFFNHDHINASAGSGFFYHDHIYASTGSGFFIIHDHINASTGSDFFIMIISILRLYIEFSSFSFEMHLMCDLICIDSRFIGV